MANSTRNNRYYTYNTGQLVLSEKQTISLVLYDILCVRETFLCDVPSMSVRRHMGSDIGSESDAIGGTDVGCGLHSFRH